MHILSDDENSDLVVKELIQCKEMRYKCVSELIYNFFKSKVRNNVHYFGTFKGRFIILYHQSDFALKPPVPKLRKDFSHGLYPMI